MLDDHPTASDQVYDLLLEDLRFAAWPADTRLKATELADRYGVAAGAIREALIRLSAEGFVRNLPQRGFRTISGDARSVWERAKLRVAIEIEGARLSIAAGGLDWEANLSAAHHRLTHIEARLRNDPEPALSDLRFWTTADEDFHVALLAACGSTLLIEEQRRAFIAFRIHLASSTAGAGFRGEALLDEHRAILETALDRDAQACAEAIRVHFEYYPTTMAGTPRLETTG